LNVDFNQRITVLPEQFPEDQTNEFEAIHS
jgi:hypothetical protein